ncbi:MAG TPA: type III-A CRISPR-associated protein Cas10/Csm1 [Candidatus Syntrophosphaera thermopropionivorans]|nr:type III-A CRISPR-associated protein Cas10/Csm1 [Candidatus Syntrophosphaera thermopropionivorans]
MSLSIHHIVFAALMHDIGKVIQRSGAENIPRYESKCRNDKGYLTHKHAMWTAGFLEEFSLPLPEDNWNAIIEIASSHHCRDSWTMTNYDHYLNYLIEADNIAASWDRNKPEENPEEDKAKSRFYEMPLFSVLSLFRQKPDETNTLAYHLAPKTKDNIKPEKIERHDMREEYAKLYTQFKEEYSKMHQYFLPLASQSDFETEHFPQYIDAVDALLAKYFWCVPGNTQEKYPTSSLYQHMRNTATIAAAFYAAGKGEKKQDSPLMIVAGDLNGIQTYLYDLNPENSNKASKLLRARSFQIQMINELTAQRVVKELSLSRLNIFSNLGGKWLMLAPATEENMAKLQELKEQINQDIYQRFLGTVSLNLNWDTILAHPQQDLNMQNFLITMNRVFENLEKEKLHRFNSILQEESKWKTDSFVINHNNLYYNEICSFCHRRNSQKEATEEYIKFEDPEDKEAKVCPHCRKEIKLGRELVHNNFYKIYYSEKEEPAAYISFANMHLSNVLGEEVKRLKPGHYYFQIKEKEAYLPVFPVATYVPQNADGTVKDFSKIAENSEGLQANAVIKGDVDNLGFLLSNPWKFDENNRIACSITDYTTLSNMLHYFFSTVVHKLQEEKYPESIYTIYSGGDDFCMIGAYDKIIEFSKDLREEFVNYCGKNPHLHFSAAITLMHPKQPIRFSIHSTDARLELAKSEKGKDSLYLYELVVNWKEVPELLELSKDMDALMNDKKLTQQFLYRLLSYHNMYINTLKKETDIRNYMYQSLLFYDIRRNLAPLLKKEDVEFQNFIQKLLDTIGLKESPTMKNIRIPVCHTIYKHRKKTNSTKNKEDKNAKLAESTR